MNRCIREPAGGSPSQAVSEHPFDPNPASGSTPKRNWRFRVPDGETIAFADGHCGPQQFVAGQDFGDFVVWRHDGVPAYQLSVVVDDAAMQITEVVRGADLLKSTARQLLLYRALGVPAPQFYHCPLMTDEKGVRLAKRHDALSLRRLRAEGTPRSSSVPNGDHNLSRLKSGLDSTGTERRSTEIRNLRPKPVRSAEG